MKVYSAKMRIQKFISQCGVCSRRAAEQKIAEGVVSVNGKAAQIGQDIDENSDSVVFEGRKISLPVEDKVVLAFNKPKGYLCSNADPFHAQTVFDLLPMPYNKMKLFCCGRLDMNSQGLLILTNDGDLANRITHPSYGVMKKYTVLLNRPFDHKLIKTLEHGVVFEGEKLVATKIIPLGVEGEQNETKRLEVWLHQGKKREIRRMFECVGYFVKELKRFQIGGYVLKRIPEGQYKRLGQVDIKKLLMQS